MKYIIHVNRHHIAANTKDGLNRPIYSIKSGNKTRYGREVIIHGPSKMVYDGTSLKCGARAWIETDGPLDIIDEMTYSESKQFEEIE